MIAGVGGQYRSLRHDNGIGWQALAATHGDRQCAAMVRVVCHRGREQNTGVENNVHGPGARLREPSGVPGGGVTLAAQVVDDAAPVSGGRGYALMDPKAIDLAHGA